MLVLEVPPDTTDGHPVAVRIDHQQRYWLFRREELPAVFDAQGNFLQVVGRTGDGPGEYRQPYDLLLVSRDTLLILDGNDLRGTFLDTTARGNAAMT